jgi:hypothetical protein
MVMPGEQAIITAQLSTAGSVIKNQGLYFLASTSTGGNFDLTIQAPEYGKRVEIICRTVGSTSSWFNIDATSSGYTFDGTNDRMTMGAGDAIALVGYSSARYLISNLRAATTMSFSTST